MKQRPILMSAPMVRATLDGSKTQTRRVMKKQPYLSSSNPPRFSDVEPGDLFICPDDFPTSDRRGSVIAECESVGVYHCMGQKTFAEKHSHYGQPGDRLWVREAWRTVIEADPLPPRLMTPAYRIWFESDHPHQSGFGKLRPSMFMPRWAGRITLEIVSVRAEQLKMISERDARAEGVTIEDRHMNGYCAGEFYPPSIRAFRELWESINGAGSWDANPWVWVVEFKRVMP